MRLIKETLIDASPERVFDFHAQPGAFERLTPPWVRFRIVRGLPSVNLGDSTTFQVGVGPFWVTWVAEIVESERPRGFSDRQVRGPFAKWLHRHRFLPEEHGRGTILRDDVEFELPLGPLGKTFLVGRITDDLNKMFDYRHKETKRLIEISG